LLAVWYRIEVKPSPSIDMSNPAFCSAAAFFDTLLPDPDRLGRSAARP
jgi:hypothetical protein